MRAHQTGGALRVRPVAAGDWPQILRIQDQCYAALGPESPEVMRHKAQIAPDSCWVAEHGEQLLAYLLTHPWRRGAPPALDARIEPPAQAELLYLHDLAVSPGARGSGAAPALLARALAHARRGGLRELALVAVQGAAGYWRRHGFAARPEIALPVAYGADACYMHRSLSGTV